MIETKEKAQGIHRELILRIQGERDSSGDWKKLMRIALHYGSKPWEIVEPLPMGERIITTHRGLLSSESYFFKLAKKNNGECDRE